MRIIFTNGCFDIVHRYHLELFKFCKQHGRVIVGLNSDASVRRLKGDTRPINNQEDRKFLLESIKYIDEVIIFDEDTPYNIIKRVRPSVIVKGGDYKAEDVVGSDLAEVLLFPYNSLYSTTGIINKIKKPL